MAIACMLRFVSVDAEGFAHRHFDRPLREFFALVGVIYLPRVCALLYGETGRIERRSGPVAVG